jgi:hypothetical protein
LRDGQMIEGGGVRCSPFSLASSWWVERIGQWQLALAGGVVALVLVQE